MKKTIYILILFLGFISQCLFSQGFEIPETPKFQTSVYDYINLLSPNQKANLENKLIKYSDTTSTQVVVAIISSTEGEEIGYLATNWAHKWGIGGSKEKDNGVFMLLAKDDRKVTIRTGYGTEHLLTDYVSRQIIEYDIIPYFKQGDYYAGLNSGVDAVFKVMSGEYKGSRKQSKKTDFSFIIFIIILVVFFIIISSGSRGNRGGGRGYRKSDVARGILETIILSNAGRGGFGGGSFGGGSSGGFGSGGGFGGGFGGGGFGGGGATGGW
ncbi:conserved hypothetical protein [Tenacibaculum sediminilitoris]|uniref:TPM domain-containing protein n=1 Tax=Tenacibaculum sediminilitoris TaxID=1820334 RepID=UPI003893C4F7